MFGSLAMGGSIAKTLAGGFRTGCDKPFAMLDARAGPCLWGWGGGGELEGEIGTSPLADGKIVALSGRPNFMRGLDRAGVLGAF